MLRSTLLFLSRQKQLRRFMETSPIAARLTRRFIAGLSLAEGLAVCRKLKAESILATLDHLGENVTTEVEAEVSCNAYLEAVGELAKLNCGTTVSVKLTQMGLDLSEDLCRRSLERLVVRAKEVSTAVEVDMESSAHTGRTLSIVSEMHRRHGAVRAVVQAYLFRSEEDVLRLCEQGVPVRLCKGAYDEPHAIAYKSKRDVNANYLRLIKILLERGAYPAVASHDHTLVRAVLDHARAIGLASDRFEFQMLYGVRRELQSSLVAKGCRLRLYVPYGDAWYPYFMRRLAERPANLLFGLRSLVRH